eukprot:TRINITY_DN36313_c0_g1_i1.p1 TRINITY_DN36313_c0_g1~~TRINITY_DN36313_c0_g1_i1.p1  ORF type:complete len:191 (-),score=39.60 TRINITY_DN36313_c0_g1_i1:94-591(-)
MLRSLVGSEMCIRDRVSTQSTGKCENRMLRLLAALVVGQLASPQNCSGEVVLPQAGMDLCHTLAAHCGAGREGAECMKAALEPIVRNGSRLAQLRSGMLVSPSLYFLCDHHSISPATILRSDSSLKVRQLTQMLREARRSGRPVDLERYRASARWTLLDLSLIHI